MPMKPATTRHCQRGLSLVELMVGVAIGLFIVAAAALLTANQLVDNRRLLLETQLQQDMRATLDIMSRQLRRAGLWQNDSSLQLVASPRPDGSYKSGAFTASRRVLDLHGVTDHVTFVYYKNPFSDQDPEWGFKLVNGGIDSKLGLGGWQELTDRRSMKVTELRFTPSTVTSEPAACPRLCPDGTRDCWPRAQVRSLRIDLTAEALSDSRVRRQMSAQVRLRNHLPVFSGGSETQPCP